MLLHWSSVKSALYRRSVALRKLLYRARYFIVAHVIFAVMAVF